MAMYSPNPKMHEVDIPDAANAERIFALRKGIAGHKDVQSDLRAHQARM